ncbi:MAG: ribbon-helix-helix protein, CopG family [Deltaproteobacteria bacterium]|nr:ribbon-helix-helix protein, CopG family [Deltaproteobacteria bacterium]
MGMAKVAITLDEQLLGRLDRLVKDHVFPSRSKAIQEAVADRLDRLERTRLARECAKLDPAEENDLAEESLVAEADSWPEY